MRTLKFVHRSQLAEHLAIGWAIHGKRRVVAMWLIWEGEGYPRHPDGFSALYGLAPGVARHPGEEASD